MAVYLPRLLVPPNTYNSTMRIYPHLYVLPIFLPTHLIFPLQYAKHINEEVQRTTTMERMQVKMQLSKLVINN